MIQLIYRNFTFFSRQKQYAGSILFSRGKTIYDFLKEHIQNDFLQVKELRRTDRGSVILVRHKETKTPYMGAGDSPLLGVHDGVAYYLLYNGILGDKRPREGNVLTRQMLTILPPFAGPRVIYGTSCRLGPARLDDEQITFKQIPTQVAVY